MVLHQFRRFFIQVDARHRRLGIERIGENRLLCLGTDIRSLRVAADAGDDRRERGRQCRAVDRRRIRQLRKLERIAVVGDRSGAGANRQRVIGIGRAEQGQRPTVDLDRLARGERLGRRSRTAVD